MILNKTMVALTAASLGAMSLAGCDDVYTTGSVSTGVYYDSMMWNDYYRPYPPARPNPPPGRPVHPIAPPPRPSQPIHRPSPRAR
ncbi:hypothetical protein SAMN05444000_103165 [Shimia gijangensis]|uniref:Lipoprotein n=1 Tax=Shimia gijangensis TaxID=1470563 RepID=A0A1M6EBW4_9RHOB|nr:hypothetical protein [Shimia gijangensis]SHI82790.1 hypothetical protein SAMN05444000_103165 [Shimia gijangensis]